MRGEGSAERRTPETPERRSREPGAHQSPAPPKAFGVPAASGVACWVGDSAGAGATPGCAVQVQIDR